MAATVDVFDTNPSAWEEPLVEARSYLYTWVTSYGEEGPPSAPAVATGIVGQAWTVTLTPPTTAETTGRALATARIYRTVTGSNGIATYFFVAEVPITQTTYSDAVSDTDAASNNTLETTGWTPPPTDLQGMVAMPNGMIAGWRSNELWFCEPYRPHAWPSAYTVTTEHPIVGLGVLGQSLVVCTSVQPYIATGINPSSISLSKISAVEPCVSRASIVSTIAGVYYASPNGVVEITPSGARLVTSKLMTRDKWGDALPISTLRATQLGQAYYTFGSGTAGALIDLTDPRVAWTNLTTATTVYNVWADNWTGETLILTGGKVYWVNLSQTNTRDQYVWRSKVFQTTSSKNFEAARVWFEPPVSGSPDLTLKVYAGGVLRVTRSVTASGRLIRLPSGFKEQFWQFELSGSAPVYNAEIATTAKELVRV